MFPVSTLIIFELYQHFALIKPCFLYLLAFYSLFEATEGKYLVGSRYACGILLGTAVFSHMIMVKLLGNNTDIFQLW